MVPEDVVVGATVVEAVLESVLVWALMVLVLEESVEVEIIVDVEGPSGVDEVRLDVEEAISDVEEGEDTVESVDTVLLKAEEAAVVDCVKGVDVEVALTLVSVGTDVVEVDGRTAIVEVSVEESVVSVELAVMLKTTSYETLVVEGTDIVI